MSVISETESVFWEEPYTIPGPCKTCCLRCPCPSIITAIVFVVGLLVFSAGAILAGEETVLLFISSNAFSVFRSWNDYISWAIYVQLVVMVLLAVVLLSLGFLGTGSTRKERMCKFKNRATGRCQTSAFILVAYFMFFLWLAECFLSLAPVMFFVVQNRGVCQVVHPDERVPPARDINGDVIHDDRQEDELCIDLRQWGLVDVEGIDQQHPDYQGNFVCGSQADRICNESYVLWFWCACFGGACIVLLAVLQFLINMSANFAKLRKGFKKGRVHRKSGTYITPSSRAGSLRSSRRSLRGSRNSLLRGSKHSLRGSRNNMLSNGPGSTISVSASQPIQQPIQNGTVTQNSTLRMNAAFESQPPMSGSGDNLVRDGRDDYYLTPSFVGNMNTGYNENNPYNDNNPYHDNNGSNSSWGANTNNGSTFTNLKAELEDMDKETPYAMSNGTHQLQSSHVGSHVGSHVDSHADGSHVGSHASSLRYAQPDFSTIGSRQPLPTATSTFSEPDPPSIHSMDSASYNKERHEYFI